MGDNTAARLPDFSTANVHIQPVFREEILLTVTDSERLCSQSFLSYYCWFIVLYSGASSFMTVLRCLSMFPFPICVLYDFCLCVCVILFLSSVHVFLALLMLMLMLMFFLLWLYLCVHQIKKKKCSQCYYLLSIHNQVKILLG